MVGYKLVLNKDFPMIGSFYAKQTFISFVAIQLPKPHKSALGNCRVSRKTLPLQPLFIKFPLVANKVLKRALMPLFFR
jgi:hypothetical protein